MTQYRMKPIKFSTGGGDSTDKSQKIKYPKHAKWEKQETKRIYFFKYPNTTVCLQPTELYNYPRI